METALLLAWLGFMIPLVYSAGPNNVMCAATGARAGLKRTLPFIAGINSSLLLLSLLIGFGIGKITSLIPDLSKIISVVGAAFLFYLAIRMIRSSATASNDEPVKIPGYWEGFIINSLNPKGIIGLSIMFNEFISTSKALPRQVIVLSVLTVLISASAHFAWAVAGGILSAFLKSEKAMKIQGYVFGIMLAGVAIWMLFY